MQNIYVVTYGEFKAYIGAFDKKEHAENWIAIRSSKAGEYEILTDYIIDHFDPFPNTYKGEKTE